MVERNHRIAALCCLQRFQALSWCVCVLCHFNLSILRCPVFRYFDAYWVRAAVRRLAPNLGEHYLAIVNP